MSTKKGTPPTNVIIPTGGQIDEVTMALIVAANDSDSKVRNSIGSSLHDIGYRKTKMVVSSCVDWLYKNGSKAGKDHKVIILGAINKLIEEKQEEISQELAINAVGMAMEELVMDREVVPELQEASCKVLVNLATLVPQAILDALMSNFQPGAVPHYFVIKTLGDVASANPVDVVPRLKEVIQRMNPLLASLKHDNLKWVFATTLWQFCDAIQSYVANIEKGKDKSIALVTFSGEMFSAFEFLLSRWSSGGEMKLRLAVLRALGQMMAIFTPEQYEQQVPKVIPALLGMLKKEKNVLHVTQALCAVLDAGVKVHSPALSNPLVLTPILATVHAITTMAPDFSNSAALKNYSEALRCFEVLARGWPEAVLTFVLGRLEPKDIACKLGALAVLKHLVVSTTAELEDKKGLLVSGIKPLVAAEANTAVRKSLAQLIIAMASHGYLELEGGETLVEFVVRCCSFEEPRPGEKATMPPLELQGAVELREVCDNILFLATTTIPSMERVLWPYLLELTVPHQYAGAASSVAKSLAYVAARKRESGATDYWVDFDKHVNLPKPQQIIAKLFVLLCQPLKRAGQGVNILAALKAVGPLLHPAACDMWDEKIPKLVAYLEEKSAKPDWDSQSWEELANRLLAETLRIVNDDEWAIALGDAQTAQMESYARDPHLKQVAMKQLGIVLQRSNSKDFVKSRLEAIFQSTNHADDLERQGCATAVGYCSASHLDIVLEKLQAVYPLCTGKRGGGLFSFGSSSSKSAPPPSTYAVEAKNTVMLAYGYVASYANTSLITSRVEIHIVNAMRPTFASPKSTLAQRTAIAMAINLIARAMHPSHLQAAFVFKARDELVKAAVDFLSAKDADLDAGLRLSCLEALASLCLLEPGVGEDLEKSAVTAATRMYTLGVAPPPPATGQPAPPLPPGTVDEKQLAQLLSKLDNLLAALLFMQPSIAQLRKLLGFLSKFCSAEQDVQRERAMTSVHNLLRKFIQFAPARKVDSQFTQLGESLALPLPRCTDTSAKVRRTGVECVGLMLYIDHLMKAPKKASGEAVPPPECLKLLNAIRDRVELGNPEEQLTAMADLAGVLAEYASTEEAVPFLVHGIKALLDPQPQSQLGVAAALDVMTKRRGKELAASVPAIVGEYLTSTAQIKDQKTIDGAHEAFRSLAAHHLTAVVGVLLEEPVPHAENVVKLIQALAKDEAIVVQAVNHLAALLNTSCLHEEKTEKSKTIYAPLPTAMAATAALGELLALGDDIAGLVDSRFAQFFCTVVLRIGTCSKAESRPFQPRAAKDAKPLKPMTVSPQAQAAEAARQLVGCLRGEATAVRAAMDEGGGKGAWAMFEDAEKYSEGVTRLTRAVFSGSAMAHADEVHAFLAPFTRGNYAEQRVVTTVVYAELIAHCEKRPELLERLMTAMTEGLAEPLLKIHVLRGLGNIAADGPALVDRYASTVVDALTPPLSGQDEALAMEAITGLSKVFEVVDEVKVSPFLVNLCAQIRPSFEKDSTDIRAAAFNLFGALARFGASKSCAERFLEQIHAVMPAVLLHMNDEETSVQHACKYALRRIAPLTGATPLVALVEKPVFDPEAPVTHYDAMAEEISKELIAHFPDRISYYLMQCVDGYKSQWNRIKANAAVMTGTLLGNLPPDKRNKATLNPTIITRALIALLKEKNAEVRQKAAEAMAVLYTY